MCLCREFTLKIEEEGRRGEGRRGRKRKGEKEGRRRKKEESSWLSKYFFYNGQMTWKVENVMKRGVCNINYLKALQLLYTKISGPNKNVSDSSDNFLTYPLEADVLFGEHRG